MDAMTLLRFAVGLGFLILGAEVLVRGAARLAAAAGIPPLVIGLTVVAFGTSSPELAVSVHSAATGQADLALGNVVGSNIFNVLLILGVSALVAPLVVSRQLIRLDVPVMIVVSLLAVALGLDGRIGRLDGLLLAGGGVAYTVFLIRQARREGRLSRPDEFAREFGSGAAARPRVAVDIVLIVAGLGLLVLGSQWLVVGAVAIARALGLDEMVIGLTIVAAGTSLPEVATSLLASFRGERDIAVGNVVGSNIFNVLAVLGVSAAVSPDGIGVPRAALTFDLPVMTAVAFACLPIFFTGYRIARWEGALFLAYYAAYTVYLVLAATGHAALPVFAAVMMLFVLPLTVVTLTVIAVRALRRPRGRE